jgi:hypothetical protein
MKTLIECSGVLKHILLLYGVGRRRFEPYMHNRLTALKDDVKAVVRMVGDRLFSKLWQGRTGCPS